MWTALWKRIPYKEEHMHTPIYSIPHPRVMGHVSLHGVSKVDVVTTHWRPWSMLDWIWVSAGLWERTLYCDFVVHCAHASASLFSSAVRFASFRGCRDARDNRFWRPMVGSGGETTGPSCYSLWSRPWALFDSASWLTIGRLAWMGTDSDSCGMDMLCSSLWPRDGINYLQLFIFQDSA